MADLKLLQQAELRLAVADTADKFEHELSALFAAILLKAESAEADARAMVVALVQHIHTRCSETTRLPMKHLVLVCKGGPPTAKALACPFLISGFKALTKEERFALVPEIFTRLSEATDFVLDKFMQMLFIVIQDGGKIDLVPGPDTQKLFQHAQKVFQQPGHLEIKISFFKFLLELPFEKESSELKIQCYLIFMVGTCDSNHEVVKLSDEGIKKRGRPDFEDAHFVDLLYSCYFETQQSPLKVKVVNNLCRSLLATNHAKMLQLIEDGRQSKLPGHQKLKVATMQFIVWVSQKADLSTLKPHLNDMLDVLCQESSDGWQSHKVEDDSWKGFNYQCLGLLAERVPSAKDVEVVELLFKASQYENLVLQSEIVDAMVKVVRSFVKVSSDTTKLIELIKQYSNTQYSHIKYLALRASQEVPVEVRAQLVQLFIEFVAEPNAIVREEASKCLTLTGQWSFDTIIPQVHVTLVNTMQVFEPTVKFLRLLLLSTADAQFVQKNGGSVGIYDKVAVELDDETRQCVRVYLDKNIQLLEKFQQLLMYGLQFAMLPEGVKSVSFEILAELLALAPLSYLKKQSQLASVFQVFTYSNNDLCRQAASLALALIAGALGDTSQLSSLMSQIQEFDLNTAKSSALSKFCGQLDLLGQIYGCCNYLSVATSVDVNSIFPAYVKAIQSTDFQVRAAALRGISSILAYSQQKEANIVLDAIDAELKSQKEQAVLDLLLQAVAKISVGLPQDSLVDIIFSQMETWSKQKDVVFVAGECLSVVCGGWSSSYADKFLLYQDNAQVIKPDNYVSNDVDILRQALSTLIQDYVFGTKSQLVKLPTCVWLYSLTKFCAETTAVKELLPKISQAFQLLLSENNVVSDIASMGIGLVYVLGDKNLKSQLVKNLVGSLTETSVAAPIQNVTGDTKVFEVGALGEAPDGSNITTYKELCQLASDMNQPDLVYQFMGLASHNKLWSQRKGAAYGFSGIVAAAQSQLEPLLPTLIPKLYRYLFDPNWTIRQSMMSIWNALVKQPNVAMSQYLDVILADLIQSMGDKLWRTREASCLAMSYLIQQKDISQFASRLDEIWNASFRALDDVKESVRVAAFVTCRTLTNATVKKCDPTDSSIAEGKKTMAIIVPFVMTKGLQSSADDVRKFSLATILKICKQARELLLPHIVEIVPTLVEKLSELEPAQVNYLSFHTEKYNITESQLDSARAAAMKASPVMEAIDSCLSYADGGVLQQLTPLLTQLIRKAIGIPTKAGLSQLLLSLSIKQPQLLREDSESVDAFVKALSGAIQDRSEPVRRGYAISLGYLFKYCSTGSAQKLLEYLQKLYCESEEVEKKSASSYTFEAIAKHSADRFHEFEFKCMPVVYYGLHDSDKSVSDVWQSVWENNTGQLSNALERYMTELLDLVTPFMTSQSWNVRTQAANTIANAAKALKSSVEKHLPRLLPLLTSGLAGKTYAGKEKVLEALCIVSTSVELTTEDIQQVSDLLLKESKRNTLVYKMAAVQYLGEFLIKYHDKVDLYSQVKAVVEPYLANAHHDANAMEVDDAPNKAQFYEVRCLSFLSLTQALPSKASADDLAKLLVDSLQDTTSPVSVKQTLLQCIEMVIKDHQVKDYDSVANGLLVTLQDSKYIVLRQNSFNILTLIKDKSDVKKVLKQVVEQEKSPALKDKMFELISQLP